uniref:Uncharacterized protein n=1 Tax=Arundo donax TaxID=35708 RepID=A0A0A9F6F4_ARUDO
MDPISRRRQPPLPRLIAAPSAKSRLPSASPQLCIAMTSLTGLARTPEPRRRQLQCTAARHLLWRARLHAPQPGACTATRSPRHGDPVRAIPAASEDHIAGSRSPEREHGLCSALSCTSLDLMNRVQ